VTQPEERRDCVWSRAGRRGAILSPAMGADVANGEGGAAMRSPVGWSVLGLLVQRPSHGYEVAKRFESTYGEELKLSSVSHVYPVLNAWIELARREFAGAAASED
jgi:hypothetical protein